ncbi:cysteine desulfurase-like protein [Litchfieldella qijiaojingensis]|uniref:Cysteine desulfurase-like protein n=1 Tax=Litchfieldella qijiaojingensis TaxID=980347 RepID=A0ABQ2ZAJ9_9GAMM|nr:aminotransferase class V-fold PLP-dependent enzyme [Halomonas qijiaojingensis]GGY10337.1 cysteine desulfurase-like protein [Halomonas qijiaojingensis]
MVSDRLSPSPEQLRGTARHFPTLAQSDIHGIRIFADNSSRAQMPAMTHNAISEQALFWETHRGGKAEWDTPRSERAAELRFLARRAAAELCGGQASEIGFAANGTSALAILANAMFGTLLHPGDSVVITEADHDANRLPWQRLVSKGVRVIDVPVAWDGGLDHEAWARALKQKPKVVALCMLSNVTGVVLPYIELASQAKRAGACVILDAVQGPPHGYTDIMAHDIDMAMFSNCKLFSPHLGWWAIKPELVETLTLSPPGGNHPALEWGTFSHAAFAGFVATHRYLTALSPQRRLGQAMAMIREHEAGLVQRFFEKLPGYCRPILLAADTGHQRVPIFSLAIPPERWARTQVAFLEAGIDVRVGQFGCPATLRRLASDSRDAALRLSFVHYNEPEDIDAVCDVLAHLGP